MNNLTDAQLGYLAGLFDGEGTVGYYKKTTHWSANLAIYNTDARVMQWILQHAGCGRVYLNGGSKHKGWQWQLNNQADITTFLRVIRPHLVIKGEQVDLLLTFWAKEKRLHTTKKLSPEVIQLRQQVERDLKSLKTAHLQAHSVN